MKWTTFLIPCLILLGGVITITVVPIDPRLKALILAADTFAAIAVGLLLWRANGPK